MALRQQLANLLGTPAGLELKPSATRSALVQQLLSSAQQNQGRGSKSLIESLDIASAPLLAALLGRRQDAANRQQSDKSEGRSQALAGALSRASQPGAQGEAARQASLIISGGLPESPLAQSILAQQASSVFKPASEKPAAVTEIGKINQDIAAGNITPETGAFLVKSARNEDSRSIFEAETSLRKEFNNNLGGITQGLSSLANAKNLLELEENPIGAQAALTAFVRAIDNSVVRPSEQAQYQNVFGLAQSLENRIGQILGEGAFSEDSKREIGEAINALSKAAEGIRDGAITFYGRVAKDAGLNPENVTGFTFAPKPSARSTRPSGTKRSEPSGPIVLEIP